MAQIRINKTAELEEVLAYLRSKYRVLTEAEIIKVALAEKYSKETLLYQQSKKREEIVEYVDEETEKAIGKALEEYKKGQYTEIRTDKELKVYLKSL